MSDFVKPGPLRSDEAVQLARPRHSNAVTNTVMLGIFTGFVLSLFVLSVPYIALMFLAMGTAVFITNTFKTGLIDRHCFPVLGLYAYLILFGLLVGAFESSRVLSPGFVGGEGRVFLAYLPVLLVFAMPRALMDETLVWKLFKLLVPLMFLAVLVGLALGHKGMNVMFGSHHAAGYAAVACFCVFFHLYKNERQKWQLVGLLLALTMIMIANSRTSVLALALAMSVMYYKLVFRPHIVVGVVILVILALFTWSRLSPDSFARIALLADPKFLPAVIDQVSVASQVENPTGGTVERTGRFYNILTRIILWVKAFRMFELSPLFGVGPFRFNDDGLVFSQILPGIKFAVDGSVDVTSATAHNSYFHVLAEGGIVGMLIYLAPWLIFLRTLRIPVPSSKRADIMRQIAITVILFILFGALSGHLLAAPSGCFWGTTLATLAVRVSQNRRAEVAGAAPG